MDNALIEWKCPKKNCNAINDVNAFRCKECGYNLFLDTALKNALWLTLFKFSVDVFLLNILQEDQIITYSDITPIVDAILLTFFGIINIVHLTLKFDKNIVMSRCLIVGAITAFTLLIFFVLITTAYNFAMGFTISSFAYKLELNSNIIFPIIFPIIGSIIGGLYSGKIYKPINEVNSDMDQDEPRLEAAGSDT